MGRTAHTEPQYLYNVALYLILYHIVILCDSTLNLSDLVVTLYNTWSDIKI